MDLPATSTDQNLQVTANNVAYSVQIALGPSSDSAARIEATTFCNNFIQTASPSELCGVGFLLTGHTDPAVTRTGLQFIEHVAKFQWQLLQEREEVKERLFVLMQNGLQKTAPGSGDCPAYLQEAVAKVIVEIAKREWPQLWPKLFPRLFDIASSTDLALLVLRRMVEDVATLQTVDCPERRRELSQSLTAIAPDVISTFFRVLVESVKQYQSTNFDACKRRAKVCLGCLLPYIEWNNPTMFAKENRIPILFALLPEPQFQTEAAECLSQLLERKPTKKEDRYDIPKMCLEDLSFTPFLQAVCSADGNNYDFLRKLGDILGSLASNSAVGKVNVENLFQGFEKLANRGEAISVLGSATAINLFMKNIERESYSSELDISSVDKHLIRLLTVILNKFVSSAPKPTEKEDMSRLKSEFSTLLRTVGRRVPKLYSEVNTWLHTSLSSANAVENFQWEALVLVVDAVASSVSYEDGDMVTIGLVDLEKCYTKFSAEQSIELKSIILSTVSALFVFLSLAKKRGEFGDTHMQLMVSIFDSLIKCFHYEESPAAREIRRHSASLLIKLSSKFPDVMAMVFDFIHSSASAIASQLTAMEYNSITEALIITSNAWNDPVRQSTFIGSLLRSPEWQEISAISDSADTFTRIFPENIFFDKKAIFIRNLSILYAALRRVKKGNKSSSSILQQNSQNASSESGNGQASENEAVHPAYDHVCPVLPIVLKLVKTIHSLLENSQLKCIMEMNETEKACVLGVYMGNSNDIITVAGNAPDGEKTHPEKLKVFVHNIQELAHGILGESSCVLSPKFYTIPQLGDAYLSFVGYNSQLLDDFRLRGIIRSVFKPFLLSCPTSQASTVLKPFAQKFFPFMLERLVNRWTVIENAKSEEADGQEEKEVIENSALRLLTKEYIELLGRLIERSGGISTGISEANEVNMDMDNEGESGGGTNSQVTSEIGEIGLILLSDPVLFTSIVNCIVTCICWDDSVVCLKAARIILITWDLISQQVEVVRGTFATTLRAVCVWVENEANADSLLKILDACFKTSFDKDPIIPQMLLEWGAPQLEVQKLIGLCRGPKNDKKRKDLFRKLVQNNPSLERNKSPKSQWLRGLPQLQIPSSETKTARQNSPEIDLNECFSLIHN